MLPYEFDEISNIPLINFEQFQSLVNRRRSVRIYKNKPVNNSIIETRDSLINLLENICDKNNIPFYNPTKILDYFDQKNVMNNDLIHYNRYYHDIITRLINYNIIN